MNLTCFIDYDNLSSQIKRQGIESLISTILCSIEFDDFDKVNRAEVRLYGGWYDELGQKTLIANELANVCNNIYPKVENINGGNSESRKVRISCELAFSLLETPGDVFYSTYRRKQINYSVRCSSASEILCMEITCPADVIRDIIKKGKCNISTCLRPVNDFLFRSEQKMVDTMMTCDILYSLDKVDMLIIVTNDEDFVPVLKTISGKSKKIYHVETISSRQTVKDKYKLHLNSINI